ncbi:sialidase-3-like isoform X1 [Thunnus thynnus]|uniref:sialidase-3-like isoform X1 n=2 Tax=Thunnus thynnus TaxID=8237 RepID=UPI003528AF51
MANNRCQFEPKMPKKTLCRGVVYRIPALIYIGDQKILAFAEKRTTSDDTSTVALEMKTGEVNKNESTHEVTIEWSDLKPVKEAHLDGYRPMNPCPVYEKTSKTLFLFFICVEGKVQEHWQISNGHNKARLCYIKSNDVGQNWSEVTDLTDKLDEIKQWATFAVGPGHGLQMESGRLIVPLYAYYVSDKSPYALCLYSDDQGNRWTLGNKLEKQSCECEMAEVFDDTGNSVIYCNARSPEGQRVEAVSENEGDGFMTLRSTKKLVETGGGCHGSVVSFPAQSEGAHAVHNKWLLFIHPTNRHKRVNLGVYLNKSPRNPKAWSKPWIINHGPSGYSDLAYIDDGWFVCLMECGEKSAIEQIAFEVFSYSDLKHCTDA